MRFPSDKVSVNVSLGNTVATQTLNPLMVKPFWLTYLAKGGGGGVAIPSRNLNHYLSDFLLVID